MSRSLRLVTCCAVMSSSIAGACSESSDVGASPDASDGSGGSSVGGAGASGGLAGNGGNAGGAAAPASGGRNSTGGNAPTGGATSTGGAPTANGGSTAPDGGTTSPDGAADGNANDGASVVTAYGDFVGVCAYKVEDFPALQAIGVKHARFDRPTAQLVETARTYGIELLPIADYGFSDLSGQSDDKYPPLPQNRAEWAKRMVDNWRGMQDPPKVIEVWNEPWHQGFWKPAPDAAAYLELVKAFASEAWSVWPNVTLLVSADEGYTNAFRKTLLAADTTGFLKDRRILPTTHNYVEARTPTEVTGEPCKYDLDRWHCAYDDFKAHGHPDPRVWVTEFGWESDTSGGNATAPVSEALQASYTTEALRLFHDSGKVAKAISFMFNRNDPWNYNWLRPDNSQKPVCSAVHDLISNGN